MVGAATHADEPHQDAVGPQGSHRPDADGEQTGAEQIGADQPSRPDLVGQNPGRQRPKAKGIGKNRHHDAQMEVIGAELDQQQGNQRRQHPFIEVHQAVGQAGHPHYLFFFAIHCTPPDSSNSRDRS